MFSELAELLKENDYKEVHLCFRSDSQFVLDGSYFKLLGEEYKTQNPMYTVRTFPEKITSPDGTKPYKKHEGGLLYLMRVQMEDYHDMHKKWYLDAIIKEVEKEKNAKRPKVFASDEDVF